MTQNVPAADIAQPGSSGQEEPGMLRWSWWCQGFGKVLPQGGHGQLERRSFGDSWKVRGLGRKSFLNKMIMVWSKGKMITQKYCNMGNLTTKFWFLT